MTDQPGGPSEGGPEEFDLNSPASADNESAEGSASEFDLNTTAGSGGGATPLDERRRLRRSSQDRMVSGVAGGVAEYFEVDAVIVRLAFVLGTVFGAGVGLLIYIVAWIVMPGSEGRPVRAQPLRSRLRRRRLGGGLVFGLILIIVGAVALLASTDAVEPGGDWILVGLAALLVLIGALILVQARRGLDGGLVFWGVVVTAALVIALQVDLSFESGFGERSVSPDSVAELEESYSHAFGELRVDLRDLELPEGTTHLSLDIAFGSLIVDLPRDIAWRIEAEAVFGSADLPGRELSGISSDGVETSSDWETATSRLDIGISAAFGSAEVRR